MKKSLFDQTYIKKMSMKNRFIAAAVGDRHAVNGHMTDKDFLVYENLAKGGAGTVITGFTYITDYPVNETMLGIYDDSFITEYSRLTAMVHQYKTNIIMQLVHPGSFVMTDTAGAKMLGPSEVENLSSQKIPSEMTKQDIKDVQQAFADAALRAKRAGFDGVELHAAHGFLLNQFLTPYYNRRSDEYGGTDDNRARMLIETFHLVRKTVGEEYPIFVKINCDDGIENGITYDGFHAACKQLTEAGADAIEVSGHWFSFKNTDSFYYKDYTAKIAQEKRIPMILVGGINDFEAAAQVLESTDIEYFAMARPLIAEPDLINRWAAGNAGKSKCIGCNNCTKASPLWGRCILNKDSSRE